MLAAELSTAWVRRQQFLARLQAAEISKMLFGEGKGAAREVSTGQMMGLLGAPKT